MWTCSLLGLTIARGRPKGANENVGAQGHDSPGCRPRALWAANASRASSPRGHPPATPEVPLCYLPREVFFGRLGFAGAFCAVFFAVWISDFGRFLPATSTPSRTCSQAHPSEVAAALCRPGWDAADNEDSVLLTLTLLVGEETGWDRATKASSCRPQRRRRPST